MTGWTKLSEFDVAYAPTKITKWRSSRTGLQLTYIAQALPIVNGYFAIATETEDDLGAPHTLEHLVFMGLKKYPYKGLLDTIGNRLFSLTNAWTAVDQTVYTLQTAGWDGFKTLLPVYLDHLFEPTITDAACKTEVYHIDGKGKERGVVFLEMQGIESQLWFILWLEMQRCLYRKDGGYSSKTGGVTLELRDITPEQIRDFHQQMYRSDNCCVVITGSVDEGELLQVMDEFDQNLAQMVPRREKRPFVDSKPEKAPKETIVRYSEFPDRDESFGEILISWIGPHSSDILENVAADMVGLYLTDSAISILNKELVEIEDPLATDIEYLTDDYLKTGLIFEITGVPTERLAECDFKIKEIMAALATDVGGFDLEYMKEIINQQKLKFVSDTEKSPRILSNFAIVDFLYGDDKTLEKWTKDLREYDILLEWTASEWCSFVGKWFVENKSASVLGKPSAKLYSEQKVRDKKIAKWIKEKYGKEGLEKLERELEEAKKENDKEIPDSLLTQFQQPDALEIEFISTEGYGAGSNDHYGDGNLRKLFDSDKKIDLFFHFEHFPLQFTTINIISSSGKVDPLLLRYLSIIEEIFTLPLHLPNGDFIPYEKVVSDTSNDLIEFSLDNSPYHLQEVISLKVKCESKKYTTAIDWLLKIMYYSVFSEERVRVILEKLINSIPDKKRDDELMMYSAQYRHLYDNRSVRNAQDPINTEQFFKDCLESIKNGNFEHISKDLNKLREQLFDLNNLKVFVTGNCDLKDPVSSWEPVVEVFKGKQYSPDPISALPHTHQYWSKIGKECSKYAHLVTTPASDTTHLLASAKMTTDYNNKAIPAIALAQEYLTAIEGPFWRGIRGVGLAYGADVRRNHETGFVSYLIYRGSDAQEAWLVAKKIVDDYASGKTPFDKITMENAVAATINNIANNVLNATEAADEVISDVLFKNRGKNYIAQFVSQLSEVTEEQLVEVMNTVYKPIFDPKTSVVFASMSPTKLDSFAAFLKTQGYTVTVEAMNAEESDDEESGSEDDAETDFDDDDEDDDDDDDIDSDSQAETESE